jgi:hypothetical protein
VNVFNSNKVGVTVFLNRYPLFSLQEAREVKKLIIGGIDPVAYKKNNKDEAVRNVKNTFQAIALEWYENRKAIWKDA